MDAAAVCVAVIVCVAEKDVDGVCVSVVLADTPLDSVAVAVPDSVPDADAAADAVADGVADGLGVRLADGALAHTQMSTRT